MTPLVASVITSVAACVPSPLVLRGWRPFDRWPRVGLTVWASLLLVGLGAVEFTLLRLGLGASRGSLVRALAAFVSHLTDGHPLRGLGMREVVGLSLAIDIALITCGSIARAVVVARRERANHRAVLDMVSGPHPSLRGVRVLEHDTLMAYFLPGDGGRVVLTRGALDVLGDVELTAVAAHEEGHRRGHHGAWLMTLNGLTPFVAFFPLARYAPEEMTVCLEMLADDFARTRVPPWALRQAFHRVAGFRAPPATAFGVSAVALERRGARLDSPAHPRLDRAFAFTSLVAAAGLLALLANGRA